jgi:uroporphyrinogen decarboxylase
MIKAETDLPPDRAPDFTNLLKILRKEKPSRPTLFEFILDKFVIVHLTRHIEYDANTSLIKMKRIIDAYRIAGYDYATMGSANYALKSNKQRRDGTSSTSLNDDPTITDRKSFAQYPWAEPDDVDYNWLDDLAEYLPDGMKLMVHAPDGLFETVLKLVGHENLCYMLADDPELVEALFAAVGKRYLRYYERCAQYEAVGVLMQDDDWGFNTQTFLSVNDMRKYVIPWHIKFAETAHKAGKPIVLHSCGNIARLMDDVIDTIKYDGKHSYEDNIMPVEEAYDKYQGKIAILGGIDVDYLCRSTPEQIYYRSCAMLDRAKEKGGYALGSGNSIPYYVPLQNYLAMNAAALMNRL